MNTSKYEEISSQWVGLQEILEAISIGAGISLGCAKKTLSEQCLDNLRPLLSQRSGTCVIVTDSHDRRFNEAILASLAPTDESFSYSARVAAAYTDFSFSLPSLLLFVRQRGLKAVTAEWEKWMIDMAPALRSKGLLYESNHTALERLVNFANGEALSLDDAAAYLSVGRSFLDKHVRPYVDVLKLGHRTVRITRDSLDQFIQKQIARSEHEISDSGASDKLWLLEQKRLNLGGTLATDSRTKMESGTLTSALGELEYEKALRRLTEE